MADVAHAEPLDQDDCWACAGPWSSLPPGSVIQAQSGGIWTVVYHNLDGYGVIEGSHPDACADPDMSTWPHHTHMLRDEYGTAELPCIGCHYGLVSKGSHPKIINQPKLGE